MKIAEMSKFPSKEAGRKGKSKKETEGQGKDGKGIKEGTERKGQREKGLNGAKCRQRRSNCVRRNDSDWLATRK